MNFNNLNVSGLGSGIGQLFGGLFGDSSAPYEDYEDELRKHYNQSRQYQEPFYNAGKQSIPQYQDWLNSQKNPADFINQTMNKYQESPYAKFQQDQMIRAAQNAGSRGDTAAGGLGSTPLTQFMQQNARDLSSQDMMNWLGKVLGVNTQYGEGLNRLMTGGQTSANQLSDLSRLFGTNLAESKFGQRAGENQDRNNIWGGLINTGLSLLPLFL